MKKEDLFQILGETDENLLEENITDKKFISGWVIAAVSIAACIAVSAGLIYLVPKPAETLRNPSESVQTALQSESFVTTSVQTVTETTVISTAMILETEIFTETTEIQTDETMTAVSIATIPETTILTETQTTVRSGNDMAVNLPYMTTEGETAPIPEVLPNLQTARPPQEITVQSSATIPETTTETVSSEIPLIINTDTIPETLSSYQLYISPAARCGEIYPENRLNTILLPDTEIGIDEENGYVSMIRIIDSYSMPLVGVLTKTDSGYECQISGKNFTLERSDESTLIFDGEILKLCTETVQPFADIQTEQIQTVSIYYTPQNVITCTPEEVSDFMEIFRNIRIYCKSLSHQTGTYEIAVKLQDGTVYTIVPTQSFLLINGTLYHADEASRKALAEFCQFSPA